MEKKNPFTINFGRIPNKYINRDVIINEIIDILNSDIVDEQAFKITGIRGTGKTVTLSSLARELSTDSKWIVVHLRPSSELTNELVANLYSDVPMLTSFIDKNINLSAFGIGINISDRSPVASIDVALRKILQEVKKQKKRVLVLIDEVQKTDALIHFVQEFQILISMDLPIYLICAGLYEDIEDIENADGLTFFLRASKYEMSPLNLGIIRESYRETLNLDYDTADELSKMTKGYAFAYQAFGKYMWDSNSKIISDYVLAQVDAALYDKVYYKIWSELTISDKYYLTFLCQKDNIAVSDLLEITKKNHSDWSRPRKRLKDKGIISTKVRGYISISLPRFDVFIKNQLAIENP